MTYTYKPVQERLRERAQYAPEGFDKELLLAAAELIERQRERIKSLVEVVDRLDNQIEYIFSCAEDKRFD